MPHIKCCVFARDRKRKTLIDSQVQKYPTSLLHDPTSVSRFPYADVRLNPTLALAAFSRRTKDHPSHCARRYRSEFPSSHCAARSVRGIDHASIDRGRHCLHKGYRFDLPLVGRVCIDPGRH